VRAAEGIGSVRVAEVKAVRSAAVGAVVRAAEVWAAPRATVGAAAAAEGASTKDESVPAAGPAVSARADPATEEPWSRGSLPDPTA